MSTIIQNAGRQVALKQIHVPDNVRALDDAHVKALAGSIKLQGILVPVVVRDNASGGYELVAGFHRVAAARELGLSEVPVVVRDADNGDHRDPKAALAWLWKYIDAATTAGELYGRALVVIAAEQHASKLVVAAGQRMPATRYSSQKDLAAKALKKLAGPHVPASLTRLEQAVKRAHTAYDKAEAAAREQQRAERRPAEAEREDGVGGEFEAEFDEAA